MTAMILWARKPVRCINSVFNSSLTALFFQAALQQIPAWRCSWLFSHLSSLLLPDQLIPPRTRATFTFPLGPHHPRRGFEAVFVAGWASCGRKKTVGEGETDSLQLEPDVYIHWMKGRSFWSRCLMLNLTVFCCFSRWDD